jgi:hypothetical protein
MAAVSEKATLAARRDFLVATCAAAASARSGETFSDRSRREREKLSRLSVL